MGAIFRALVEELPILALISMRPLKLLCLMNSPLLRSIKEPYKFAALDIDNQ